MRASAPADEPLRLPTDTPLSWPITLLDVVEVVQHLPTPITLAQFVRGDDEVRVGPARGIPDGRTSCPVPCRRVC